MYFRLITSLFVLIMFQKKVCNAKNKYDMSNDKTLLCIITHNGGHPDLLFRSTCIFCHLLVNSVVIERCVPRSVKYISFSLGKFVKYQKIAQSWISTILRIHLILSRIAWSESDSNNINYSYGLQKFLKLET